MVLAQIKKRFEVMEMSLAELRQENQDLRKQIEQSRATLVSTLAATQVEQPIGKAKDAKKALEEADASLNWKLLVVGLFGHNVRSSNIHYISGTWDGLVKAKESEAGQCVAGVRRR